MPPAPLVHNASCRVPILFTALLYLSVSGLCWEFRARCTEVAAAADATHGATEEAPINQLEDWSSDYVVADAYNQNDD